MTKTSTVQPVHASPVTDRGCGFDDGAGGVVVRMAEAAWIEAGTCRLTPEDDALRVVEERVLADLGVRRIGCAGAEEDARPGLLATVLFLMRSCSS